jgi:DnaJ-class molecular chaperone
VFHGEGDATEATEAGDLVFVLVTAPHKTFTRQGSDLRTKMEITLKEALTGVNRTIKHLDGREVLVKSSSVIVPGMKEVDWK